MKQKELIKCEIENFILYFTSDDTERQRMSECLDEYMREVFEEQEVKIE